MPPNFVPAAQRIRGTSLMWKTSCLRARLRLPRSSLVCVKGDDMLSSGMPAVPTSWRRRLWPCHPPLAELTTLPEGIETNQPEVGHAARRLVVQGPAADEREVLRGGQDLVAELPGAGR